MTDDEPDDEQDDEPAVVLCSRISRMPIPPVPAIAQPCGHCRQPIWVATCTAMELASRSPVPEFVCMQCGGQLMADERARGGEPNIGLTDGQVRELRNQFGLDDEEEGLHFNQ